MSHFEVCPICHGTGMRGKYLEAFEMFIDFECDKCKGKGWIKDDSRKDDMR